ncbi:hypothetical protein FHU33_1762 [Blastococcus colisei]|uniref:Nucleotidyltransferase-like protein n=1 Tax=Blastococcus colisei TaxID=1564162 RepID=A0A543PE56_9ACTN|nr:nucleotidyltransferase [Blastococcus colisei]TQN42363.1 hypothetical protein FHU33_1762 [Blastococcus colisei]
MTTTLDEFVKTLAPAQYDKATVAERHQAMEIAVAVSSLRGGTWFESGSWSHGTALKGHSDVDFMIPCSGSRPVYPSSALTTLKTSLAQSHWAIRDRRISSPTVKVEFFTAPHFEVVPAWHYNTVGEDKVFLIPGPGDQWEESAPRAHLRFVTEQNDRLGKKVKPLARLLKQWKAATGAPVSSFYLEMRTAEYAKGEDFISFHIDMRRLMGRLINHGLRDMNDPAGRVSRIRAVSSEESRRKTVRLLQEAKGHLDAAYDLDGQPGQASPYWSHMYDVFGSSFPYPTW